MHMKRSLLIRGAALLLVGAGGFAQVSDDTTAGPGDSTGTPTNPTAAAEPEVDIFLDSIPVALSVSAPVRARVDRLLAAVRTNDHEAFVQCFDIDVLIDRGMRIMNAEATPLERVAIAQATIAPLIEEVLDEMRSRVGSHGTQVRMEKQFDDGTTYVVLRTRRDADALDRYVHLCLQGGDRLSIVDFEFEDSCVWGAEQIAYVQQAAHAPATTQERLKTYALAFEAALQAHTAGKSIEAIAKLETLQSEALALGLQAPVVYWRSMLETAFSSGRREIAANAAHELIKLRPATPLPRFYLGRMALDDGRLEAARMHLTNYQRLVGPDAQALAMIGDSYELSGELDRALEYWRAALDQNPDLTDAMYSLGMYLNGADTAELIDRFRATAVPLRHFEPLVSAWSVRGRCSAVAWLSEARREDEPRDPNAYYYEATCELKLSNFDRVQELAMQGRALVEDDQRGPYDALWIEAAWSKGDPLEAYRSAPDKAFAFDAIGEQLVFGGGELEQLLELIELRRADDPQDVWIPYYQGQACQARGLYSDADEYLRIGYTHALETEDADRAAAYRMARTDNAYAGGSGVAAYQQMPEEDVYRRLLELILSSRDGGNLAQLIALRRERKPGDPQLGFWLAHAQIISGQEAAGLERLMARRGEFAQDPDLARWLESDLVRANLRLGRLEQAMQFAEASTRRDRNPFFEFVVQVWRGNAAAAENLYGELVKLGYGAEHVYGDQDIGRKLMTDETFSRFRTLHPPPRR